MSLDEVVDSIVRINGVTGIECGTGKCVGSRRSIKVSVSRLFTSTEDLCLISELLRNQHEFAWTLEINE